MIWTPPPVTFAMPDGGKAARSTCSNDPLPNGIMQQDLRPTIGPHRMHNPGPLPLRGPYRLITRMAQCVQKWVNNQSDPKSGRAIVRPVLC